MANSPLDRPAGGLAAAIPMVLDSGPEGEGLSLATTMVKASVAGAGAPSLLESVLSPHRPALVHSAVTLAIAPGSIWRLRNWRTEMLQGRLVWSAVRGFPACYMSLLAIDATTPMSLLLVQLFPNALR